MVLGRLHVGDGRQVGALVLPEVIAVLLVLDVRDELVAVASHRLQHRAGQRIEHPDGEPEPRPARCGARTGPLSRATAGWGVGGGWVGGGWGVGGGWVGGGWGVGGGWVGGGTLSQAIAGP